MSIIASTQLKLYPAAANPGDDTSTAGGAIGTVAVVGTSSGEIVPRMRALATGTIDVNIAQQWQKAFAKNLAATSNLLSARIYIKNGLVRPSSGTGTIFIVLTNVSDAGKQVRMSEVVSGAVVSESVNTPSAIGTGAATSGSAGRSFVCRAQLVDASTGAQVSAVGDVQIWWSASTIGAGTLLGIIPGQSANGTQWSWATEEVQLLGIATSDDTSTITNRRTAPSGTFTRAYTYATGIVVRLNIANDTLGHGIAQGLWIQETLQPTTPPNASVQYCWVIEGDDDGA